MVKPVVRKPWERRRVVNDTRGDSLTHQSHIATCDINRILANFDRTGTLPDPTREAQYGDVTGLQGDLTERINSSREVLDEAGRAVDSAKKEAMEEYKKKQLGLEQEVERLRELERQVNEKKQQEN